MSRKVLAIAMEEYVELSESGGGICLGCEARAFGVEPDARNYTCEECGEPQVFGAEELLLSGRLEITDEEGDDE